MITEQQFKASAKRLNVEVAAIKAVAEVESGGNGFLPTGEPIILFEPHIFWKELRKRGLDPNRYVKGNEDILYPSWGAKPYGKISQQHSRLARAVKIHREAALCSASWGKFQILGTNFKLCGYKTIQQFVNAMYDSEDKHLEAFCGFIENTFLDDELRAKNWPAFARGFNGIYYWKNNYDKKMAAAYIKFSS